MVRHGKGSAAAAAAAGSGERDKHNDVLLGFLRSPSSVLFSFFISVFVLRLSLLPFARSPIMISRASHTLHLPPKSLPILQLQSATVVRRRTGPRDKISPVCQEHGPTVAGRRSPSSRQIRANSDITKRKTKRRRKTDRRMDKKRGVEEKKRRKRHGGRAIGKGRRSRRCLIRKVELKNDALHRKS